VQKPFGKLWVADAGANRVLALAQSLILYFFTNGCTFFSSTEMFAMHYVDYFDRIGALMNINERYLQAKRRHGYYCL